MPRTDLGQGVDETVDVGGLGRSLDLVHADGAGVVSVSDVLRDAAAEQHRLLRHDAHLGAQPLDIQAPDIAAVHSLEKSNKTTRSGFLFVRTWSTRGSFAGGDGFEMALELVNFL